MVCAGDKTKLLVISMRQLRRTRLTENDVKIQVNVCGPRGEEIDESTDEKLLGVIVSNKLTWKTHLYSPCGTNSKVVTANRDPRQTSSCYKLPSILPHVSRDVYIEADILYTALLKCVRHPFSG